MDWMMQLPNQSDWTLFGLAALLAGLAALGKLLVSSRSKKRGWIRVLVSAFWGGLGVWVMAEWIKAPTTVLMALSAALGWAGYEAMAGWMLGWIEEKAGVKLNQEERGKRKEKG